MQTTNHLVQPGETLSKIAGRHGCSVAQLRQLNPFIRDNDQIQAGWNLSVPGSVAANPATPATTAPPQASAASESNVAPREVLQLDQPAVAEAQDEQCFAEQATPACSPRFASIIYATQEKAFWLLPQRVVNAIKEAAHRLDQDILPTKSPSERKKGLDANGLLEHFLEPRLSYFLEGEEQAWMQRFEAENPLSYTYYLRERQGLLTDPRNLAFPSKRQRFDTLERWLSLHNDAVSKAREEGYDYQAGMLFSPQSVAARSAVQAYLKARNALLEQGELPTLTKEQLAEFLSEAKQRYDAVTDCTVNCRAQFNSYMSWKRDNQSTFDYADYINAILEAADFGLALPEFALIDDKQMGIASGVERFKDYLSLLDRQRRLEQRLQEKYQSWVRASGENLQAPSGLVDAERAEWDLLEEERVELHQQATWVVANTQPRRHLLWEPEQFQAKPVERLVKTGFPLREVSLPDTPGQSLRHLSVSVLQGLLRPTAKRSASFAGNSDGKAAKDHEDSDFHDWLLGMGAVEIKDQSGNWFDPEGWFDVERFYQYVSTQKGYRVDSLQSPATRIEWGERLRQVLFQDDAQRQLRLFDSSPQAQLVRCLTPPQSSIHSGASVEAPSFSILKGINAGAEAYLDVDLARGEVELLKVDLPERTAAQDVQATYMNYQDQCTTVNLGRFSIHLGARAWGYAGASMLLAANLDISLGNSGYGASLSPIEPASRSPGTASTAGNARSGQQVTGRAAKVKVEDGLVASFNLFAGVQAGIKVSGALNWAPPSHLVLLRTAPAAPNTQAPNGGWLSLARLDTELAGAIGAGARGEINLSLSNGCLILRIKAALIAGPGVSGSLAFAVGYEAVVELINLVRRELRENQYHHLDWIEGSAFDAISKLNLLGAVGIDVGMVYMMSMRSADVLGNLYEALTSSGKGGPIAHAIMTYENQAELEQWFVDATPEALGPMLMTLLFEPEKLEIVDSIGTPEGSQERVTSYDEAECHLLQQRAIEKICGWLVRNAQRNGSSDKVQRQFNEACSRMNRFGTKEPQPGQAYCTNRMRMDQFMAEKIGNIGTQAEANRRMRENYMEQVKILGGLRDGYCQRSSYYGRTFIPGGLATYTGPGD